MLLDGLALEGVPSSDPLFRPPSRLFWTWSRTRGLLFTKEPARDAHNRNMNKPTSTPRASRSQQQTPLPGSTQAPASARRAQSLPMVRRSRRTVTASVSLSEPSSPRRCEPQPSAATVVEVCGLVEFVTAALDLDKPAHEGIQDGPAEMRRCEPAPEQSGAALSLTHRHGRSLSGALRDTAVGRSDSGLSAGSTERGDNSPTLPQRIPPSKTPSAAPGISSRDVRALAPRMLEELHVNARLRAVRPARGQKLQSSMD